MNIAIVASEFNHKITSKMLEVALEKAEHLKINVKYTCKVSGIYDMPTIIDELLSKNDIDAVVTLGAVIKGQTKHDEVIAHTTAKTLQELSIKHKKAVSLGISGPGMQERQAYARIRPVAERAVEAAVNTTKELQRIR
ncbi:MAG: 6,7-dimethyl-8-ribityllumazine synthase [Thaumarchaeota archaeon]|nr:6,7-dimethyl-8-ribityllumazine synthase [Nitrososphaerota archaeon]